MRRLVLVILMLVAVSALGAPKPPTRGGNPIKPQLTSPVRRGDTRPYLLYADALNAEMAGDWRAAGEAFRAAHGLDPTAYEPAEGYARYLARTGKYAETIALMDSVGPWQDEGRRLVADCLRLLGRPKEAIPLYREVIESSPDDAGSLVRLYFAQTAAGQKSQAKRTMTALVGLVGDELQALILIASTHAVERRPEEARRVLSDATRRFKDDPRSWTALGDLAVGERNLDQAERAYREGLDRLPADTSLGDRLIALYIEGDRFADAADVAESLFERNRGPERRRRLAILQMSAERYEASEASLLAYLAEGGGDPGAQLYLGRARLALSRPDSLARASFDSFLSRDSSEQAWIEVAMSYLVLDRYADGAQVLSAAAGRFPESRAVWRLMGSAYIGAGEYGPAVAALEVAVGLDPGNRNLRFSLASSYERAGRFDDAVSLFEVLISEKPDDADALNYLGYMLADKGVRLFEAQSLIERALEVEPNNYAFIDSYGWALYRQGFFTLASRNLERAVEALEAEAEPSRDDAVIYDHLGDAYSALGRPEDAARMWRRALELDPANEAIRRKVQN